MTDEEKEVARLKKTLKETQLERDILKRPSASSTRATRKYRFVKQHLMKFPVELVCKIFKVSKSAYYHWLHAGPSKLWIEN